MDRLRPQERAAFEDLYPARLTARLRFRGRVPWCHLGCWSVSGARGAALFPVTPIHVMSVHDGLRFVLQVAMAPESRAEIERAQTLTHYPIGGELLTRTRYGDECFGRRSDTAPCHDCGVTKGQLHIPCCEVEECPNCHTQLLSCDCNLGDARSPD